MHVHDPVDGVEAEHLASDQGAFEFVDEVVVPGNGTAAAVFRLPAWLGSIHVAIDGHDPQGFECVGDNGSLGRPDGVELAAKKDDQCSTGKHAETEKVAGPEANVFFHVWSRQ